MSWTASVTTSTATLAEDLNAAASSPPDLDEGPARQFAAAKVAAAALVAAAEIAEGPLYVNMSGHSHSGADALDFVNVSVGARAEQPQTETPG